MIQFNEYRDAAFAPVPILRRASSCRLVTTYSGEMAPRQIAPERGERALRYFVCNGRSVEVYQDRVPTTDVLARSLVVADLESGRREAIDPRRYSETLIAFDGGAGRLLGRALYRSSGAQGQIGVLRLPCVPLGGGFYSLEPGHPVLSAVEVGGVRHSGAVSYSDTAGALYLERADGSALETTAVSVIVSRERLTYVTLEDGVSFFVSENGYMEEGDELVLSGRGEAFGDAEDVRRTAKAPSALAHHATDTGLYDVSYGARRHRYIIRTNAPPELVEEAARACLPAGYLYRILPPL